MESYSFRNKAGKTCSNSPMAKNPPPNTGVVSNLRRTGEVISLIFLFTFFLNGNSFTQSNFVQKVKLPILECNNNEFEKLLKDIVTYETKHCSIEINRSYYIKMKVSESKPPEITISSDIDIALDIAYGVFYIDEHAFFVNESMNNFFLKSQDSIVLKKEDKVEDSEGFFLAIIDDSQTLWEFLFKNGSFQFWNFFSVACEDNIFGDPNPLKERRIIEIELIEEDVDDIPSGTK